MEDGEGKKGKQTASDEPARKDVPWMSYWESYHMAEYKATFETMLIATQHRRNPFLLSS